jgi:hypothetical protein
MRVMIDIQQRLRPERAAGERERVGVGPYAR